MEEVRPGTGREAGLGHAGGRAPKVGALGEACSNCREGQDEGVKPRAIKKPVSDRLFYCVLCGLEAANVVIQTAFMTGCLIGMDQALAGCVVNNRNG